MVLSWVLNSVLVSQHQLGIVCYWAAIRASSLAPSNQILATGVGAMLTAI